MKHFLITLLCICFSISGQAQIKDFLKKVDEKVNEAIEEIDNSNLEEKLEQAVEDLSEEIEEGFEESQGSESNDSSSSSDESSSDEMNVEKESSSGINGLFGILGGPPENVEPNPETISFDMRSEIVSSENRRVKEGDGHIANYAFDTWKTAMQFESYSADDASKASEAKFVMDLKEKTNVIAFKEDGDWTGMKMWMPNYSVSIDNELSDEDSAVRATGNTKMIEGYNCEEFEIIDDELTGTIWATKDIDIDMAKLMQSLLGNMGMKSKLSANTQQYFDSYFWLESDVTNDGVRTVSKIRNINKGSAMDSSLFNLDGIPIKTDMTK